MDADSFIRLARVAAEAPPATEAPLGTGDVLMLDTGLAWDGYFCDYDRNVAIGTATPAVALPVR